VKFVEFDVVVLVVLDKNPYECNFRTRLVNKLKEGGDGSRVKEKQNGEELADEYENHYQVFFYVTVYAMKTGKGRGSELGMSR